MLVKMTFVRMLFGSWEGLESRDVASGRSGDILVDCRLCCCIRRWPLRSVLGDEGLGEAGPQMEMTALHSTEESER
jgi:hypothetical protein